MIDDRNDTFADRVRAFLDGSSMGDDQADPDGIEPR